MLNDPDDPTPPARARLCARCDGPIDVEGWACCSLCAEAAARAVARWPGRVVTWDLFSEERWKDG